jgi:uncharacterized OB-fold protein
VEDRVSIEPTRETQAYWEAAKEGRVVAQRCRSCGTLARSPRRFCPPCGSEDVALEDCGKRATVHTFSVVQRAAPGFHLEAPFVVALVEFGNGHRMMTNILTEDHDAITIGQAVELVGVEVDGLTLPCFRPLDG